MGLFSIYTGFCYNDIFSKAFLLTESYWVNLKSVDELAKDEYIDLDPSLETREPYVYGKDPIWAVSIPFYYNLVTQLFDEGFDYQLLATRVCAPYSDFRAL